MTPERWRQIELLVEQALEQPEGSRRAFIEGACGEDVELHVEVVSLLTACERSPEYQSPPTAWFESLFGPDVPRFSSGDEVAERYRIDRLLGRGGMGEVYEAWDDELSIEVALKTLHLPGSTEDAHKRLKREGLLARSVWHPNVCRLYDLGRHGEGDTATWFLTMELLRGDTLASELRAKGRLPLDRAQRFAEQTAAGLGAAHRAGVVHRDLKPGNIIIVERYGGEQAVVTDFGIAQAASPRPAEDRPQRESGPIVGTPAYMAPEQVRGEEIGPAADIYALGVVLFELVTGKAPFAGGSAIEVARRRLMEDPPSPRRFRPELDHRWEAVILRCLARDPRRRFGRAEDVAAALGGKPHADESLADLDPLDLAPIAPRNLPAERDLFVGREVESKALDRRLTSGSPLVTLLGAGGMGKTRLALHYAWRNARRWTGGVWPCDLTEARSLDGIAAAVAASLGVELRRGDPIEQIGHAIAGRGRCLVLLDNFDQVVELAASSVGRWLGRASEAQFLVTSREKLGLEDQEALIEVGPMSTDAGVELFVARARRLRPGLELVGTEAEAASEIVRLVDGMPLAIELASARMRIMSAVQIVAQMRSRFSLLTGGGSARHETLVIAIDGSWELLKPWERSAWAQCAVFEGGFTLDAAEEVIDLRQWPGAPWVLDVVQSLVDKSLLRTWVPASGSDGGILEPRFGMFVSLQEYSRMRLREDLPGEGAAEQRHGRWYARYGTPEAIAPLRVGAPNSRQRVERELDNLILASRRAVERGDAATAVAAFRASWAILGRRGPFGVAVNLGREILERLRLGQLEAGHVLRTLGIAEWYMGMVEDSRPHQEAALAIARELPDQHLEALVLLNLGGMSISQGHFDEGSVHLEAALVAARAVGDRYSECNALDSLSVTRRGQGRTAEAGTYAEMAIAIARREGYRALEGNLLNNVGILLQQQGHTEEARAHFEEALVIVREVGSRRAEGDALGNLGRICHGQGRMDDARAHVEAALAIYRETGARMSEGTALYNLGLLHKTPEESEAARAQLEAALAIARELGNRRLEGNIIEALGGLHQGLGEMELARADYESALAIHRQIGDRRSEACVLTRMASLLHRQGLIGESREALTAGELLFRQVDAPGDLAELLCMRAELEHASGAIAAALVAIKDAGELAARIGSGPDSGLGRMISNLERTLGVLPPRARDRNMDSRTVP